MLTIICCLFFTLNLPINKMETFTKVVVTIFIIATCILIYVEFTQQQMHFLI